MTNEHVIHVTENNFSLLGDLVLESFPSAPSTEVASALQAVLSTISLLASKHDILITRDLSAMSIDGIPFIFLGSNYWWVHRFLPPKTRMEKAIIKAQALSALIPSFSNAQILHLAIPEKDSLCLPNLLKDSLSDDLITTSSTQLFLDTYSDLTGSCNVSLWPVFSLLPNDSCFEYFDSHLPTPIYLQIADKILNTLNGPANWIQTLPPLRETIQWLDLGKKFDPMYRGEASKTLSIGQSVQVKDKEANAFQSPLRDTRTGTINAEPILDMKALICGDSHSSIIGASKLTDIFSCVFRELDFTWNPYCGHGLHSVYIPESYDVVILETTERFIYGLP